MDYSILNPMLYCFREILKKILPADKMLVNFKSRPFFESAMSRPPSHRIARDSPTHRELVNVFKQEKDGAMVHRFLALILMHERQNAEEVPELCRLTGHHLPAGDDLQRGGGHRPA